MDFVFSKRMDNIKTGIFTVLSEKKRQLLSEGRKVYDLSVGTPDFKPEKHVIDAIVEGAKDPDNIKYAISDLPELIEAVQLWYKERYNVDLKKNEVMSLYGSQEGLAHIGLILFDPGDVVLIPNPGYPIFSLGPQLSGAKVVEYPIIESNSFLPDLDSISEDVAKSAKAMIVSYPANPVCKVAPKEFYEKLVEFAKRNNIIIIHDNAYSDLVFDGEDGISFLSIDGAKDVGVELNSLSKSYNLTGARISFILGNSVIIEKFKTLRSQIDYGIFKPIQHAAIMSLTGSQDSIRKNRDEYQSRRDALCAGLRNIGWDVPNSQGTMFVWAPIPKGYTSSEEFCMELINKAGVFCVPGVEFGSLGEGYVRFALVYPPEEMKIIVQTIKNSGVINK